MTGANPASEEVMSLQRPIPSLARPLSRLSRSPCLRCALLGLSAVGAGLLGGGLAHAQSVGQHSAATRLDDATPRSYDIPAGSLGASLGAFASQSGLLLSFDPALTRGRTAPALGPLQRTGRLAASAEHRPAGRGGNLRRLPAGRAAHVRRSPGRPVAGGGLGRRAGRSAEGNLYRAALVGVPLQRRHRPLRPGFRG